MADEVLLINMQSRPEDFGPCYNCADGLHEQCIGVPCGCECFGPAAKLTAEEVLKLVLSKVRQCPEAIAAVRKSLTEDDPRRIKLLSVETMLEMALIDGRKPG